MKQPLWIVVLVALLASSCVTTEPTEHAPTLHLKSLDPAAVVEVTCTEILGVRVEYNESDSLENLESRPGVRVQEVAFGSPAARVGVEPGDVILQVNGVAVDAPDGLETALASAGQDKFELVLERGALVLEGASKLPIASQAVRVSYYQDPVKCRAGFRTEVPKRAGDSARTIVAKMFADSPMGKAGILEGDQVVSLNGEPVESAQHLIRMLAESCEYGQKVDFRVMREGDAQNCRVRLWEPNRVVSKSSLPLLWNYEHDVKADSTELRLFGLLGVYLFGFERQRSERAYRFLWWTPIRTGYGELVEEDGGAQ